MITKLLSPNTPNPKTSGPNGDWDLAMAQLTAVKKLLAGEQMMLTEWTNSTTQPKIALGTHLQHKGSIYVVDTEDYALPALGGNGTYYIVLEASGDTLVGSWATSLAGYTWDATYNGLYNGNKLVLPYQVVMDGSGVAKRKILNPWALNGFTTVDYLGDIKATGKLTGATINTGQGDFKIGQNLRTTDAPTFATINTGQGNFKIGQNLRTTDSPEFSSLKLSSSAYSSKTLSAGEVYYLPKGVYTVYAQSHSTSVMLHLVASGGTTYSKGLAATVVVVISNGSNAYIKNEYSSDRSFHMWKH